MEFLLHIIHGFLAAAENDITNKSRGNKNTKYIYTISLTSTAGGGAISVGERCFGFPFLPFGFLCRRPKPCSRNALNTANAEGIMTIRANI